MHHLAHLLHAYGYPFITGLLALECAGLILPGETLMLAAALAAAHGHLNIWLVIAAAAAGATIGNLGGYAIGRVLGHQVLARHGWRIGLNPQRMALGRYMFACHGGKVVFLGRFVAVLRSLCPLLAGVTDMKWRSFVAWTVAGAIAWPGAYCLTVYTLGNAAKRFSGPANMAFGAVVIAVIGTALYLAKRNENRLTAAALRWEREERGKKAVLF